MGSNTPDHGRPSAVCCQCGEPVVPGQPRWAGDPQDRPWHYDCAERARLVTPHRVWARPPRVA